MSRIVFVLLLCLAQPAFAAADLELYSASTVGTITVAPDGSVDDVRLEGRLLLGVSEIDGYERHIRTWRFEPVLENGVAVRARAHMQLSLIAAREPGSKQASFGIRNVWFMDPPKPGSGGKPSGGSSEFAPPVYPAKALRIGVGAEVMLLVEVGEGGEVARVATERVHLLGNAVAGKRAASMATMLAEASERAAAAWPYRGFEPGTLVRTPVRYTPGSAGWLRMLPQPVAPPPWVIAALAKSDDIDDLAAGGALPSRLTLLSKLPSVPGLDEG